MEEDLKVGRTYIFDSSWPRTSNPFKGRIEEVTEKTVLINNLDSNAAFRLTKGAFEENYEVLETMLEDDINDIKITNEQ